MIDFWEAIGRMAHHGELAADFILGLPPIGDIPTESVEETIAFDVPKAEYLKVQNFFEPILAQGTLSIMAAGELYYTFSFDVSRKKIIELAAFIRKEHGGIRRPSSGYFIALGMTIIDKYLRADIRKADERRFEYGPRMSLREKRQITKLSESMPFDDIALAFCSRAWPGGACSATRVFWDGHLHPKPVAEEYAYGKASGQ